MSPFPGSCILCRQPGNESLSKPCGATICTIFGIHQPHPFKDIFDRGKYCGYCAEDVENAETLIGRLERIKESLLEFQSRVYTKLGDNYFQIEDKEELDVPSDLFDNGGEGVKGRTFSYNELVTAVYEKFKKDTLQWETFSTAVIPSPPKSDCATQTVIVQPLPPPLLQKAEEDEDDGEVPFYDESLQVEAVFGEEDQSLLVDDYGPDQSLSNGGVVPKLCSFCSFAMSPEELAGHEELHRASGSDFCCVICPNMEFANAIALRGHVGQVHRTGGIPCDVCGKKLATKKSLRRHLKLHTVEFACGVCGVQCSSAHALGLHQAVHSSDSPYSCETCGRGFKVKKNLTAHMKIHTAKQNPHVEDIKYSADFKWECVDCPQKFRTRDDLRVHRRTHLAAGGGGGGYVSPSKKKKTKHRPRTEEEKLKRRLRDQARRLRERGGVVMMTQPVKPALVVREPLGSRRSERMKVVKGEEMYEYNVEAAVDETLEEEEDVEDEDQENGEEEGSEQVDDTLNSIDGGLQYYYDDEEMHS